SRRRRTGAAVRPVIASRRPRSGIMMLLRAMEIRRTPDCERFGIERLGSSGFGAFPGREREVARLRSTLLQGSVRSRFLVDDRVLMAANCAGFGRYSGPRCSRRVMVSLERTAVKTAVVALGK